ncbi:hypothetical protein GCM10027456_38150 [Kineosporia babensis]
MSAQTNATCWARPEVAAGATLSGRRTAPSAEGGVQEGGWKVTASFTAVIAITAAISAVTARETKGIPTAQLGGSAPTPLGASVSR